MTRHVFAGLDLTDGTRLSPRAVDRALMDDSLMCEFDQWLFDPSGIGLIPKVSGGPSLTLAIDGPQGLAGSPGDTMRTAERIAGVAGKTPYDFPIGQPFSGFVTSSVRCSRHCGAPGSSIFMDSLASLEPELR